MLSGRLRIPCVPLKGIGANFTPLRWYTNVKTVSIPQMNRQFKNEMLNGTNDNVYGLVKILRRRLQIYGHLDNLNLELALLTLSRLARFIVENPGKEKRDSGIPWLFAQLLSRYQTVQVNKLSKDMVLQGFQALGAISWGDTEDVKEEVYSKLRDWINRISCCPKGINSFHPDELVFIFTNSHRSGLLGKDLEFEKAVLDGATAGNLSSEKAIDLANSLALLHRGDGEKYPFEWMEPIVKDLVSKVGSDLAPRSLPTLVDVLRTSKVDFSDFPIISQLLKKACDYIPMKSKKKDYNWMVDVFALMDGKVNFLSNLPSNSTKLEQISLYTTFMNKRVFKFNRNQTSKIIRISENLVQQYPNEPLFSTLLTRSKKRQLILDEYSEVENGRIKVIENIRKARLKKNPESQRNLRRKRMKLMRRAWVQEQKNTPPPARFRHRR